MKIGCVAFLVDVYQDELIGVSVLVMNENYKEVGFWELSIEHEDRVAEVSDNHYYTVEDALHAINNYIYSVYPASQYMVVGWNVGHTYDILKYHFQRHNVPWKFSNTFIDFRSVYSYLESLRGHIPESGSMHYAVNRLGVKMDDQRPFICSIPQIVESINTLMKEMN